MQKPASTQALALTLSLSITILSATSKIDSQVAWGKSKKSSLQSTSAKADTKATSDEAPMEAWRDLTVTPWAALLCIHGLSLHASSYASFGKQMGHLGIPTYAIDIRGFGSWQNQKEATNLDFDLAFEDIKKALISIRKAHPGLPIIILGESMGGALALQTAADNPKLVDALICSVPARQSQGQKTTNIKAALGFIYTPNKELLVGPKVIARATSNPEVAEEWEQDPLSRSRFSAKDLNHFRQLMSQNPHKAPLIANIPVLFLQGASDRLIKPSGTLELFSKIESTDKNLVMVGSAEHLIFEQGQFANDMVDLVSNWIEKHVVSGKKLSDKAGTESTSKKEPSREKADEEANSYKQGLGHFKIAEGEILLGDYKQAEEHLSTTLQIARGTALAARAHKLLLELPEKFIALPLGSSSPTSLAKISLNEAKDNTKPTILVFCAPWIEACKTLAADITTALGSDADKINVVWIDADEEKNKSLLAEYGIKPLPAILYLKKNNEVFLYSLGDPGPTAIHTRVQQLLKAE
jgi:alpha-beta hydrolase superfamily lysophospholipase/thiol-disulfide isomerase/thioredoxin